MKAALIALVIVMELLFPTGNVQADLRALPAGDDSFDGNAADMGGGELP